jgi:hypothetical protein
MNPTQQTPQGTVRSDNENIIEWQGPNGKTLQLVMLGNSTHYRIVKNPADKFFLSTMLDILSR